MKNAVRVLALAGLIASGLAPVIAAAADGTITFKGNVVSNTCTVKGGGAAGPNFVVPLPQVNTVGFTAPGATKARTRFTLVVSGCTSPGARAFFDANAGSVDYTQNVVKNTAGTGTGVGFGLWDESSASNRRITIGSQMPAGQGFLPIVAAGTTLGYEVAYVQYLPTITTGTVEGPADYTIEYQ